MKNIFSICIIAVFISLSCKKTLTERTTEYPQLNPQNIDENAGLWKPILLTSPDEFTIDAPVATNTSTYKTGINEIKSYQSNLSQENQELINYWGIGGVLRWNQIMQELVAKHNRPPYQNENGTYPIPSSGNPFANPEFPFSNPPYAARAYAYLSTAQYDALIATWYYKKKFNILPAYANDPNVKALIPKSNLSTFPSEDAVLAGVSSEILKLLFPTEISFIQQKVEEQIKYKIIAGISIRNDVEASFLLGKKVAAKYIARAATDGAGASVGNQAIWTSLEKSAIDKGETPWKSLENPVRPPMLPLFGNVNSFLISSTDFKANRPIPPPSTNSTLFLKELNEVKFYAKNATREQLRTVTFWADGVGTYTPPGHWNAIAIDLFAFKSYSEVRWARNMAMLNMAMFDAAISCWDAKYYYFSPRPCQVNPEIKTLTGVPNFPAYVSGHSTFSGAAAAVLSYIIPEQTQNLTDMANEASMSRLYGGIHYRSDCEQGLKLGKEIAKFTLLRANTDGAN